MSEHAETPPAPDAAQQPDAAAEPSAPATPEERIAALEAEVAQLRDRWLRAEAETQNQRARTERQVADARNYAIQKFARDVVEAAENLRRGLDALPPPAPDESELLAKLRGGFEGVERSFLSVLERNGVARARRAGRALRSGVPPGDGRAAGHRRRRAGHRAAGLDAGLDPERPAAEAGHGRGRRRRPGGGAAGRRRTPPPKFSSLGAAPAHLFGRAPKYIRGSGSPRNTTGGPATHPNHPQGTQLGTGAAPIGGPPPPAAEELHRMSKVIGIDLGTTNSCVAIMEGKETQGHRERRGRPHHPLHGRLRQERRAPGRPVGQAPGGDQPDQHPLRREAPDRPPLRRPDGQEGHGPRPLQDRPRRQRRRLGRGRGPEVRAAADQRLHPDQDEGDGRGLSSARR